MDHATMQEIAAIEARIAHLTKELQSARARQAIELTLMSDTVTVDGVTLYRPTLIHLWLMLDIEAACGRTMPRNELLQLESYLLLHDATTVRQRLMREYQLHPAALAARAARQFAATPDLLPVALTLLDELQSDFVPYCDDDEDMIDFGWWADIVRKIAVNYHWSEQEIFALPFVRLVAYSHALERAAGQHQVHHAPELPQERELKDLMAQSVRRNHGAKKD